MGFVVFVQWTVLVKLYESCVRHGAWPANYKFSACNDVVLRKTPLPSNIGTSTIRKFLFYTKKLLFCNYPANQLHIQHQRFK